MKKDKKLLGLIASLLTLLATYPALKDVSKKYCGIFCG